MFRDYFPWLLFLIGFYIGVTTSAASVRLAEYSLALQSAEVYVHAVKSPEALEQAKINAQEALDKARVNFTLQSNP